ncbi:serine hydrolase [Bacillus sp. FJAT-49705]|uniref:Serine hydrolase n=1 Tax=Cytobacillus citreus TaxID=2833586 RepID=A0ABS5NXN2_9BACI|nr:serine hydrolase [Cytobacillus citreus]MBS4192577.1 serine hydrolase [Cytobacillus citreus]
MNFAILEKEMEKVAACCKGRIAFVIETGNARIERNGEGKFSSASLIKIPILIEGFRQNDKGLLDFQEEITVLPKDRVDGAGVLQALSADLKIKIIDLMALMMVVSDNIATNLLIERLGKSEINKCMKEIKLKWTELNRKMMDFEAINNGIDNWTTAYDMVTCLKVIDQQTFLSKESSLKAFSIMEKQQFKKLFDTIDLEDLQVASKSGELPGVEHDCAIIRYGDRTIYSAVLIDQLKTPYEGKQILSQIGKLILRYIVNG